MEAYTAAQYEESRRVLEARLCGFRPEVLIILGSGLHQLADAVEAPIAVPYGDIPHLKYSTAPGHKGQFIFGRLGGKAVAVMQGRLHMYEGWSSADTGYPIRLMRLLGAQTLLVSNAAGAVNPDFAPGDIVLITDHIFLGGESPLRGPNPDSFGPRFPDLSQAYTRQLQDSARQAAQSAGLTLREGVYMYFPGPQYETPAEVRMARTLGADMVGMSTVPEVIVAAHCGMQVLGLTLCTNMAAGILPQPLSGDEVLAIGSAAGSRFSNLVIQCLRRM